jgi:3-mercaptopyruvate sulfurtransferase SseA
MRFLLKPIFWECARLMFIFCFWLLVFTQSAVAMERFELITTQELEQMLVQRQMGEIDFVLVNSLDEIIFRSNSIPGSVNVPWSRVNEVADRLGSDKDKLIITY